MHRLCIPYRDLCMVCVIIIEEKVYFFFAVTVMHFLLNLNENAAQMIKLWKNDHLHMDITIFLRVSRVKGFDITPWRPWSFTWFLLCNTKYSSVVYLDLPSLVARGTHNNADDQIERIFDSLFVSSFCCSCHVRTFTKPVTQKQRKKKFYLQQMYWIVKHLSTLSFLGSKKLPSLECCSCVGKACDIFISWQCHRKSPPSKAFPCG